MVRLLSWNGESGFDAQRVQLPEDTGGALGWVIGDSDGAPGEELVSGPTLNGQLMRIGAGADGALTVELAFGVAGNLGRTANPFGAANGTLMGTTFDEIQVMRWPRGGEIELVERRREIESFALGVVGTGDAAVIVDWSFGVVTDQLPQDVLVYDVTLEEVLAVPVSDAAGRLIDLAARDFPALRLVSHEVHPYVGPLPGGLGGGRDAFVTAGGIVVVGTDGELSERPTNGLVGRMPVGIAGPDDGWMALTDGFAGFRDTAYLHPTDLGGTLSIVPLSEVLPDAPPDGHLRPELLNAVVVDGADGKQRLLAPDGGFTAIISAPLLSSVVVAVDHLIAFQGEMGVEPMSINIGPDDADEGNQAFEAAIVVITPAGAAYTVAWDGEILREPPDLAAGTDTNLFELSATVSGEAGQGSAVTVDGAPVATDARGAFSLSVDAAIWPREVLVVATDAAGNETVERLSVVGLVDYRGLPWVALVAAATVAIGVVLFVRTPRHRGEAPRHADDAHLEEIN